MLIITNLLHLFDNFVYSRYNLNKTTKMKFELLIICYVSFLNSLIIKRQEKDRIFGVKNDSCEDILFGKKKVSNCRCSSKKNGTFLSGENDHYKCNNEEYLGRLFWILKVLLFVINDAKTIQNLLNVTFIFHTIFS